MTESLGAGANGLGFKSYQESREPGKVNPSVLSSLLCDTEMLIWPAY